LLEGFRAELGAAEATTRLSFRLPRARRKVEKQLRFLQSSNPQDKSVHLQHGRRSTQKSEG
jgi:hypothetical protein